MAEKTRVYDVEIVKVGQELIIPEKMSYDAAITAIERQKKYEEETVEIIETIPGFVYDAAIAFHKAMQKMFGYVSAEKSPGFFGGDPPKLISVPISHKEEVKVPWGYFTVPGVEGKFKTSATMKDNKLTMNIIATVRRKYEPIVKKLATLTRTILKEESIFRSKAIHITFSEDGRRLDMPEVKFMDLDDVNPDQLIFSEHLDAQIKTNLFTPILRTAQCLKSKIPLKRGVLLAGKYGTGKTLAARVTAWHAIHNGWTFLYVKNSSELAEAIILSKDYQPAVIFAEDIDREAGSERTDDVNEILNVFDGIDTKASQTMVVLTTNHVENINQAMFRPGRLDAVITVDAPNAEAVVRLVRLYGGDQISNGEDLGHVGLKLAGQIPAVIRECVERSKLYAISLATDEELKKNHGKPYLTAQALLYSAEGMARQLELLNPAETPDKTNAEQLGNSLTTLVTAAVKAEIKDLEEKVATVYDHIS